MVNTLVNLGNILEDLRTNFIFGRRQDFLLGGKGDDDLNGGRGQDFLFGGKGDDNLNGGRGGDFLFGGKGDDNLNGGRGGDFLFGGKGDDNLNGGRGQDFLFGGKGDDNLNGGRGQDFLLGGKGDDNLNGGVGNDSLDGGVGVDTLIGGAGKDRLILNSLDFGELADGGIGKDTLDLSGVEEGVFVDLDANSAGSSGTPSQEGFIRRVSEFGASESAGQVNLGDIENIIGTGQDDVLFGNNEDNVIKGGDGDDRIHPFGGTDFVDGGLGVDTLLLNAAPAGLVIDFETGTAGPNTFVNFENANGSAVGDDTILGDENGNVLNGLGGDDTLDGRGGADILLGGIGDDTFALTSLDVGEVLDGGENGDEAGQTDTLDLSGLEGSEGVFVDLDVNSFGVVGEPSQDGTLRLLSDRFAQNPEQVEVQVNEVENIIGTSRNDVLFGNNESNEIFGGDGDDAIHPFGGTDFVDGGLGVDTLLLNAAPAGLVIDFEAGTAGPNTFVNFENANGSAVGDDTILGDENGNVLNGLGGDDTLDGRGGADILLGGIGDDTFALTSLDVGEVLDGGENGDEAGQTDTLDLSGLEGSEGVFVDLDVNSFGVVGEPSQDGTLRLLSDRFAQNPEQVEVQVNEVENIIGTSRNDVLFGNNESNEIFGGDGDDAIHPFGGTDFVDGGLGVDTLLLNAAPAGLVIDFETGTAGPNTFVNFENANGSAVGDDTILGDAGANVLNGLGGDDTLDGREGADILLGGIGDDVITGGIGSDTFVLAAGEGTDTIVDFEVGIDFIGLADDLTFGSLTFEDEEIRFGDETLAILNGVDTNALGEANFIPV